jgi:hypothetical protein
LISQSRGLGDVYKRQEDRSGRWRRTQEVNSSKS